MGTPQDLLKRAQQRRKRCCIFLALFVITIVVLIIVIPCALLLPETKGPMQPVTVLLPLYIYPAFNAWEPLSNAVSLNSDVSFTVIVNPSNGPGETTTPGTDYTNAIRKLNEASNVQTVGYVRTGYTDRAIDDVLRDIATYSRWSQLDSSLAMSGIFFDETPHDYSPQQKSYLTTINQAVKNSNGIRQPKLIIHNPGTIPDARLNDSLIDVTVIFESSFDQFQESEQALQSLSGHRSSYSIMIHSVPPGGEIRKLLRSMSLTAEYLFLTTADAGYYEHFSDSWNKMVKNMGS